MTRTLLVALGGLLGSVGRYWIGSAVQRFGGTDFPIGTLAVNGVGSFVVGMAMVLSVERNLLGPDARLFLTVGVCGGFTTMSTFSYETMALLRDGQLAFALGNVTATLGGTFAAVWLGQTIGRLA